MHTAELALATPNTNNESCHLLPLAAYIFNVKLNTYK